MPDGTTQLRPENEQPQSDQIDAKLTVAVACCLILYASLAVMLPISSGSLFLRMTATIALGVILFRWVKAGTKWARGFRGEMIWTALFASDGILGMSARFFAADNNLIVYLLLASLPLGVLVLYLINRQYADNWFMRALGITDDLATDETAQNKVSELDIARFPDGRQMEKPPALDQAIAPIPVDSVAGADCYVIHAGRNLALFGLVSWLKMRSLEKLSPMIL